MMTTQPLDVFAPTLPGSAYTDPQVLEKEREKIFERQWMFVARAEDVANGGDFLRCTVGREDVIIVRGKDAVVRGFFNVCRHRGATLCLEESGNKGNAIRCPYHAWSYKLDGSLITAPNWEAMKSIDKSTRRLIEFRVEEWNGLIFVNLSEDPTSLVEHLTPLLEFRLGGDLTILDRYDLGSLKLGRRIVYETEANWKLVMENFQECYHCGTIHPELVEAIPAFQSADTATNGYDSDGYAFAEGREAFSLSGRKTLPRLPGLLETDDLKYFGMVLRPNAFLSLAPDHAITHRFEAISPTRTRAVCDWLFPDEVVDNPEYDLDDAVAMFDVVNKQDFQAAEWCQPNMSSRVYKDGGVLAPSEQALIQRWYSWYHELMETQR